MFTKNMPFEVKADTAKRTFEGYASTYKKDLVGDQVVQGAFKKTIQERHTKQIENGGNSKIKILWQHIDPLGKLLEIQEDSRGLYVKGQIANTTLGNDSLELLSSGIVDEMSIGYDVLQDEISEDGQTRLLKELKLYEVSAVTFGANPDTSVNSVKSLSLLNELQPQRLAMLFKEGRAISKNNLDKLQQARQHIEEIIALMESDEKSFAPDSMLLNRSQHGSTQAAEIKELEAAFDLFKNITKKEG